MTEPPPPEANKGSGLIPRAVTASFKSPGVEKEAPSDAARGLPSPLFQI